MKHLDLLGTPLKSEFLLDLLETYDVEVIYEYDRTHENIDDEYRAELEELGLQFVFDESQLLKTLFMTSVEVTTFNPFEDDERVRAFASKEEARRYARSNGVSTTEGKSEFMGEQRDWIRFDTQAYTLHYEYVHSKLQMTTLQVTDA